MPIPTPQWAEYLLSIGISSNLPRETNEQPRLRISACDLLSLVRHIFNIRKNKQTIVKSTENLQDFFFAKCMEVHLTSLLGQMTFLLNLFNNSLASSTFIFRYRTNCFPSYQFWRCEMKPPGKCSLIWPVSWSMIHKCIQASSLPKSLQYCEWHLKEFSIFM